MALPLLASAAAPALGKLAFGAASSIASPLIGGTVGTAAKAASKAVSAFASSEEETPANKKLKKTADDFESMFLEQMVDRMTQSSDTEGPLGENGTGGGVWRSMLSNEYAKSIAKSGGVGISDQIMRSMIQLQAGGGSNAA
jgi:peptidoglycan hydrolase FlgJ